MYRLFPIVKQSVVQKPLQIHHHMGAFENLASRHATGIALDRSTRLGLDRQTVMAPMQEPHGLILGNGSALYAERWLVARHTVDSVQSAIKFGTIRTLSVRCHGQVGKGEKRVTDVIQRISSPTPVWKDPHIENIRDSCSNLFDDLAVPFLCHFVFHLGSGLAMTNANHLTVFPFGNATR